MTVLHLFGGHARFGIRQDIDLITRPDVIADAWLPPFRRDSFDCVVLDPPYIAFGRHCREHLGRSAAWIARKRVVWFSSFAATSLPGSHIEKWWTVIVGNDCSLRQLVFFRPDPEIKLDPAKFRITRGPAIRYERWKAQPIGLPFTE
jgi:hypothetical protein